MRDTQGMSSYELAAHIMRLIKDKPMTASQVVASLFDVGVVPTERMVLKVINEVQHGGWPVEITSDSRDGRGRPRNKYRLVIP